MNVLIVFTLTLILTAASSFNSGGNEVVPRGRVSNGTDASSGQFPFMVGLLIQRSNSKYVRCGGTLVSNKWILTAAHCLRNVTAVEAYLGAINFWEPKKVIVVGPQDTFIGKNFNYTARLHDIALIKIPAINFTVNINAANLPNDEKANYAGRTAVIVGWGRIFSNSIPSTVLHWAQPRVLSTQSCFSIHRSFLPKHTICSDSSGGISACAGDSGGPLMLEPENFVIGVTSMSHCRNLSPVIFTSVVEHLPWIKRIMNNN